jgi:hypothetical protein
MLDPDFLAASVLGILAGALATFGLFPYVRDILMRRTLPRRSSWLIWTVVTAIAFLSQAALPEAGASLWFSGAIAGGTAIVFLLSVPFGTGRLLDRVDAIALAFTAVALGIWAVTSDPGYALMVAVAISSVAGALTVQKAFLAPHTETLSKWLIGTVAASMAVASVGTSTPLLLAQPVYLLCLHVAVSIAILLGRHRTALPL